MRSRNQRSWLITMTHTGKFEQSIFQGAQGFHIKVIGGFVEQQQVAPRDQRLRQVQATTFPARELADNLSLIAPLKLKRPM
jgi:hypothetical protein